MFSFFTFMICHKNQFYMVCLYNILFEETFTRKHIGNLVKSFQDWRRGLLNPKLFTVVKNVLRRFVHLLKDINHD